MLPGCLRLIPLVDLEAFGLHCPSVLDTCDYRNRILIEHLYMRTRCAWLHVREGAQHECYVHIWSCQGKAEHGELMKQFSQLVVPLLRELFHYCFHYRENCSITERIFITEIIVPLLRELFQC